jgi:molybdopterin-containing oxidoreductase family membrane subunit
LIAGLITMVLELGSPLHMIYYIISPNLSSPIFWMGIFYGLYLAFLLIRFWKIHNGDWDGKLSKTAGIGAFLVAIAAESTAGSIFGLIEARPPFFGQFMPIYFLLDAFLCGIATILLISLVYHKFSATGNSALHSIYKDLSKIFAFVLGITILFVTWRTISGLYANRAEFAVVTYMVGSWSFRIELFIGLLLPFALMISPAIRANVNAKIIASVFAWVGLGIGRMEMLMSGQMVPIMPKVSLEKNIILYDPTIWEWVIGFFSFALMLFLYTMGEKYLKLGASPKVITDQP